MVDKTVAWLKREMRISDRFFYAEQQTFAPAVDAQDEDYSLLIMALLDIQQACFGFELSDFLSLLRLRSVRVMKQE